MLQPKIYSLSNGIPVIIDSVPGFESLTMGAHIKSGSRNEVNPNDFGAAHLLEHMAFKGTKNRDKHQITTAIEDIGGEINAYTTWNVTAYNATVPTPHKNLAIDIIADIVQNPTVPQEELMKEKLVVTQEIKSYEDDPYATLERATLAAIFRGGMQHDIAGNAESVLALSRETLLNYFNAHYSAKNCILVLSGGGLEDTTATLSFMEKLFGGWAAFDVPKYEFSTYINAVSHTQKSELSHSYFKAVWPTLPATSRESNQAIKSMMRVLGAGFSSRLFQKIREELGLVYSVGAESMAYEDIGIATIEAQTEPAKLKQTVAAIASLCRDIKSGKAPIKEEELARAKEMTKGALIMGLETTSRRADFFATRSILFGGIDDMKKNIDIIDSVSISDVSAAVAEVFANPPSIITLGMEHDLPLSEWQGWF
ncbi:MAG: insulinase family protein [Rickettsiales bacterium]|jgi:predicted Zn-dependent peptidase|nr:insulinase family protein [Rickettsiales bacterium]